ncbi:MAG: Fe-Mn family superoxide dismutase [Burkholderiaceae bacterium]
MNQINDKETISTAQEPCCMSHQICPIPFKPPRLLGLSESLLNHHYEDIYGSAIRELNADAAVAGYQSPNRAMLDAGNRVLLHEIYFDSLGGEDGLGSISVPPTGVMARMIKSSFGSYGTWADEFVSIATRNDNMPGWVLLSWSARQKRLFNHWAADNAANVTGAIPLLALDMHPHAYELDFGDDRPAYVDAYLNNLHWGRAASRLTTAVSAYATAPTARKTNETISPEALLSWINGDGSQGATPFLLDVCLTDDLPRRYDKLPGAAFYPSEAIDDWLNAIPKKQPVVVYCLYGYQVSSQAVARLREHGIDARQLLGGIASWRAIGGPTQALAINALRKEK